MIQASVRLLGRYSHINWALADQAMVSGVNFLTGILLARYLGLEGFGQFTLAWMAVLFVNALQHATIIAPMMSIGPKQSAAELPAYYGAVIVQQVVFSLCGFVVLFAAVEATPLVFPDWGLGGLGLPLASAAVAFQCQDFLRRYLFARGRAAQAFVNDGVRYFGQLAVLTWLFLSFPDRRESESALWVIAGTAAAAAFCGVFLVERIAWAPGALRATAARHWRFSRWLAGSAVMQWVTANLFLLAAGALLGTAAVGALRAAQTLMGPCNILFQGLENVVPARAAWHFQHGGKAALVGYMKKIGLVFGLVTAGIAVVVAAAPDFWLGLAYGGEYVGYGYLVRWYAVVYVVFFFAVPLRAGLRALEETRGIFIATVFGATVSVVGAYPLVSGFGAVGAVAGMAVVQLCIQGALLRGVTVQMGRFGYV
ncbi:MAG: polysaccharide biosynthesis C-terminal domain-containing protein [Gammaproteobacteria bacterium]|nr:polysaccharide biosynthesis C-terminal domain-containing protein [Gammaproteobacteria bacterium]